MKFLTVCFLVVACFACNKSNSITNLDKPIIVTSDELVDAYDNNVVGAKLKYQGKPILVTGKVFSINDTFENIDVLLDGFKVENGTAVIATVLKSKAQTVANISKGQTVTFLCTVGELGKKNILNLDDCQLQNSK